MHHGKHGHNSNEWNKGSTSGWGNTGYTGNTWGSTNPYNWHNPFGLSIPQVSFVGGCRKCGGSGIIKIKGMAIPCRKCYESHGYCVKCYGSGISFMKNKPCKNCNGKGNKLKRKHKSSSSSSSSDSD